MMNRVLHDPDESVCGVDQGTALAVRGQFRNEGYEVIMKPSLLHSGCFDVEAYRQPDIRVINPHPLHLEAA